MSYAIKMIKVECDGALREFPDKIGVGEVIKEVYGKKSGAIAALVNNEEKDLSYLILEKRHRQSLFRVRTWPAFWCNASPLPIAGTKYYRLVDLDPL